MEEPIKVLLLENRRAGMRVAQRLVARYDWDFRWQRVASRQELSRVAADFNPSIVLCADRTSAPSDCPLLDVLEALGSRPPIILVASLLEPDASMGAQEDRAAAAPPPQYVQDIVHLRRSFSMILESSRRPIVMSDAKGWITYANSSACRQLDGTCERSLQTQLDTPSEQNPSLLHRLAYSEAGTGLLRGVHITAIIGRLLACAPLGSTAIALAARNLDGARSWEDGSAHGPGSEQQFNAGAYGSIIRVSPDDYLLTIPEPCPPADAAFTAHRMIASIGTRPAAGNHRKVAQDDQAVRDAPPPTLAPPRLESALRDALQRHALSVQYQPQYELLTGRGCGLEALARWELCTGESVSPAVFIPIAEQAGMIHELGAWILQCACDTAAGWCGRTAPGSTLSVNVSALQIDERFCGVIYHALKHSGFPANQLELEITESALITNTDRTVECLKEWKKLGVRIAVDDFGTGYSSLSYLSRLPVDRLKLDQSLIQRMTMDKKSATVMRCIVSLGAELGVDVIAEGVETEGQLQMLGELGCPRVQGYLLARPMSANQARVVLEKTWGNRPKSLPNARMTAFAQPSGANAQAHH